MKISGIIANLTILTSYLVLICLFIVSTVFAIILGGLFLSRYITYFLLLLLSIAYLKHSANLLPNLLAVDEVVF